MIIIIYSHRVVFAVTIVVCVRCVFICFNWCFVCRFLRNPSELKCIKNISLLRQQMAASPQTPTTTTTAIATTVRPESTATGGGAGAGDVSDEECNRPTDLSMPVCPWQQEGPQDLSTASTSNGGNSSSSMQLQLNMSASMTSSVPAGMAKTTIKLEQAS